MPLISAFVDVDVALRLRTEQSDDLAKPVWCGRKVRWSCVSARAGRTERSVSVTWPTYFPATCVFHPNLRSPAVVLTSDDCDARINPNRLPFAMPRATPNRLFCRTCRLPSNVPVTAWARNRDTVPIGNHVLPIWEVQTRTLSGYYLNSG